MDAPLRRNEARRGEAPPRPYGGLPAFRSVRAGRPQRGAVSISCNSPISNIAFLAAGRQRDRRKFRMSCFSWLDSLRKCSITLLASLPGLW